MLQARKMKKGWQEWSVVSGQKTKCRFPLVSHWPEQYHLGEQFRSASYSAVGLRWLPLPAVVLVSLPPAMMPVTDAVLLYHQPRGSLSMHRSPVPHYSYNSVSLLWLLTHHKETSTRGMALNLLKFALKTDFYRLKTSL